MLIKVTAIWNTVRVGTVCCVREGERVKEDKLDTQSAGLEARLDKGPITPLSDSDTGTRGTEPSLGFFEGVEIRISTRTRLSLPESGSRVDFAGRLIFRRTTLDQISLRSCF